jgi:hypothetical protein
MSRSPTEFMVSSVMSIPFCGCWNHVGRGQHVPVKNGGGYHPRNNACYYHDELLYWASVDIPSAGSSIISSDDYILYRENGCRWWRELSVWVLNVFDICGVCRRDSLLIIYYYYFIMVCWRIVRRLFTTKGRTLHFIHLLYLYYNV